MTKTDLPSLPMAPAGAPEVRAPAFGLAPGWASGKRPYYQDALVTIYNADCRQLVPLMARFDLLLTDPPYGIGASAGIGKYGRTKWTAGDSKWDEETPPDWLLRMLLDAADKHIIWGGNYYALPPSRQYLVWDKGAGFKGRDFAECEQAWCSMDGNAKVLTRDPLAAGDYRGKEHPTAKPLALMTCCLSLVPDAATVLDPFAGSGTTGRACKDMGRRCVLIEREERYCEIAARRMGQECLSFDPPNNSGLPRSGERGTGQSGD